MSLKNDLGMKIGTVWNKYKILDNITIFIELIRLADKYSVGQQVGPYIYL